MRTALSLFCLFTGVAVGSALSAQTPTLTAATKTADAKPDELTSISLLAHDRKGRQVTDLKPEDLSVTDDGAPVKIAGLRLITGSQTADRMVTLVFGQLDAPARKNARGTAARIFKMFPDTSFTFAVLGVDGRLRLYQPYTSDRNAILRAVESATLEPEARESISSSEEKKLLTLAQSSSSPSTAIPGSNEESRAKTIYAALQNSQHLVEDRHTDPDIAGLTAIAQAERQLPGRKAILYFAQSAQTDVNTLDQMRTAAVAANEAGVGIFAIDMNALDAAASQGMISAMAMGSAATSNHFNPQPVTNLMSSGQIQQMNDTITDFEMEGMAGNKSPLGQLSARTGGRCIGSSDNIRKPMQQLIGDLASYYEVSYAPKIEIYDGRFHPVAVKTRRSGLLLHATSGYLALPRGEAVAAEPLDAALASVMKSPHPPTDIAFRGAILQFGQTGDGIASEIAIEIPIANLDIHEDPNTDLFSLRTAVAARIEDPSGKVLHEFSEELRRHGGLDSLDSVRGGVLSFDRRVTLPPGDYVLKTVVVDSGGSKAGSQTQSFHIAAPTAGAALSEIVLLRQPAETGSTGTLRPSHDRIVPDLVRSVPAAAKSVSVFFMVHPEEKAAGPAQIGVAISKDGKPLGQWSLHSGNDKQKSLVPYLSSLNTASLPGGSYDVTVTLKQGEATAERHLTFVKEDGASAASTGQTASAADAAEVEPVIAPAPLLDSSAKLATAPPPEEIDALIESARKRALGYSAKLPNFMCVETVDRSVDHSGKGRWTHLDTITELLRYRDNAESRSILEVDGHRSHLDPSQVKGAHSNGEFGGLLKAIFDPAATAKFQWKEEKQLSTGPVHVLTYQVAQKNSNFGLTDNSNWSVNVAFRGELYIEPETGAVRYATVEAQDLPAKFTVHATIIQVVYDYIAINNHDYLLPTRGSISLTEGRHQAVLNSLQFREYKRFSSQSRIIPVAGTLSAN